MLVYERTRNNATIITLSGWFKKESDPEFRAAIEQAQVLGSSQIILNLEHISHIDSAGVGLLCLTYHTLHQKNIRLSILNPQPEIRNLLNIAGIGNLMPIYDSEHEAVYSELTDNPLVPQA